MKKIFFSLLLFIPFLNYAQLTNGKYIYNNDKGMTCDLTVTENGWKISVVLNMGSSETNKVYNGKGYYRNEHGAGWYEFQSTECNFSFDQPTNKITIEKYDCKSGGGTVKYILTKSELAGTKTVKSSTNPQMDADAKRKMDSLFNAASNSYEKK